MLGVQSELLNLKRQLRFKVLRAQTYKQQSWNNCRCKVSLTKTRKQKSCASFRVWSQLKTRRMTLTVRQASFVPQVMRELMKIVPGPRTLHKVLHTLIPRETGCLRQLFAWLISYEHLLYYGVRWTSIRLGICAHLTPSKGLTCNNAENTTKLRSRSSNFFSLFIGRQEEGNL